MGIGARSSDIYLVLFFSYCLFILLCFYVVFRLKDLHYENINLYTYIVY